MSAKQQRPRLSKGILEMKFMQRSKVKVDKEMEAAEGREMYSQEITDKMLRSDSNFIIEPSFIYCENLIEGRLSFRGMNPEIERLLELEQAQRTATVKREQPRDVTDQEMATFYYTQKSPALNRTMQKKFQTKAQQRNNRKRDEPKKGSKRIKMENLPKEEDSDIAESS